MSSTLAPIIAGLAIGIAFIASFSLLVFPFQHENKQLLAELALTVNLDRPAGESYTNNEQPLISGYVSKAADKVSIETYYPNGSMYREDQVDVGRDGYYGHRIPMDAAIAVAGRYDVKVAYGNQSVETSFNHVVEYNHDPEQQSNLPPPSPPATGFPRLDNVSSYISSPVALSLGEAIATDHGKEIPVTFKVQNGNNFALYNVQVANFTSAVTPLEIHLLDSLEKLEPNQSGEIHSFLILSDSGNNGYHIYWTIMAGNETGTMMQSIIFQRQMAIATS